MGFGYQAPVGAGDTDQLASQLQQAARESVRTLEQTGALPAYGCGPASKTPGVQRRPCNFFLQNRCIKGSQCPFSHDPPETPGLAAPTVNPEYGYTQGVLGSAQEAANYIPNTERQAICDSVEGFLSLHPGLSDSVSQQLRELPPN